MRFRRVAPVVVFAAAASVATFPSGPAHAATGDTVTAYSTTTLKEPASYPTPGPSWQVALGLNKYSQTLMSRKLGPTGWFRVRADFTASAKDTTNVSADGGWVYYVVTS